MQSYKELNKEFRKNKQGSLQNRLLLPFREFKFKYLTKTNKAPDISTITEHIAFILDDEVVEIIHCQPKMAAILLSEPKIIKIPDNGQQVKPGWAYKDDKFISPDMNKEITVDRDIEAIEAGVPTFKEFQDNLKAESLPTFKEFIDKLKERV